MDLKQIMGYKNFVVLGSTDNAMKYAYKIKQALIENGYNVMGVPKDIASINEVPFDIDVLDLCINPVLGLNILKEIEKPIKCAVIQPGAGSIEIQNELKEKNIPFIEGCLLVGCSLYGAKVK